ncbi:hypothetical protein AB0K48_10545, partial [Nonomuraea sp. NPDC055795]
MKRLIVPLAVLLIAGCGGNAPRTPAPAATGPIGAPEKTTLKIGMRLPNLDTNAPVEIALDKGFYKEEGLTVERVEVQSILLVDVVGAEGVDLLGVRRALDRADRHHGAGEH